MAPGRRIAVSRAAYRVSIFLPGAARRRPQTYINTLGHLGPHAPRRRIAVPRAGVRRPDQFFFSALRAVVVLDARIRARRAGCIYIARAFFDSRTIGLVSNCAQIIRGALSHFGSPHHAQRCTCCVLAPVPFSILTSIFLFRRSAPTCIMPQSAVKLVRALPCCASSANLKCADFCVCIQQAGPISTSMP
ncbi:hypothetical protein B0H15DRAFT_380338 [Mycena belliarum]|uniref:Uncharacterized protein n=1 Tax=Mycena belliarum TaxID=1033014 RepID=A0AAD6XPH3_9AGAR|nr:hypothetical protein B0H15DRAFT_380338 [Mycena belliae]